MSDRLKVEITNKNGKNLILDLVTPLTIDKFLIKAHLCGISGINLYVDEDGTEICDSFSLQHFIKKGKTILVADSYEERKKVLVITDFSRKKRIAHAFQKPVSLDEVIQFANLKGITGSCAYLERSGTQIINTADLQYDVEKEETILVADFYKSKQ